MSFGGGGDRTIPSENTRLANPIVYYRDRTGAYPNNTQVWWSMKRPPEAGTDRPPKQYLEVFDPSLRYQVVTGNTPAPRGHYILDAFQQDRSSASGVNGLPVKSSNGARPSSVAFYAGRVFYSGVNTAGYNTRIYFSQIIERADQVGECYQAQDPTAEDLHDLLPSDGGVIVIPEIVEVIKLVAYGFDLFVFASNGVWRISGSDGVGFRANDYSVAKISGTPALSPLSFVDVEGVPMWWNRAGVYTMSPNQMGQLQVTSVSDQSIKTFFEEIPEGSKFYAKGAYDPLTRIVQFLYRSTPAPDEASQYVYDSILTVDVRSGAWSPWTPAKHPRVQMKGIFVMEGVSVEQELVQIVVGQDTVVAGPDRVFSTQQLRQYKQAKIKYIVNILSEAALPPPPPVAPPTVLPVVVNTDNVFRGTDRVILENYR
jgi:hypothetical protein